MNIWKHGGRGGRRDGQRDATRERQREEKEEEECEEESYRRTASVGDRRGWARWRQRGGGEREINKMQNRRKN